MRFWFCRSSFVLFSRSSEYLPVLFVLLFRIFLALTMAAKAVDMANQVAEQESSSVKTLIFIRPIEMKQNTIYCISHFLECDSSFGKTWNVVIEGDRAVRMPSFYREQHRDLHEFKTGKYFIVYGGTRDSKNGFRYGVLKFPQFTMEETLCFCSEHCEGCECHQIDSQLKLVSYFCCCTAKRAKDMVTVHKTYARMVAERAPEPVPVEK